MKDILLQDLKDHTNEGLQSVKENAFIVDIIELMNTILKKSSNAEFAELLVKLISSFYGRVYIKKKSIKCSEQLSIKRGQSEKIHIV